MLHNFQIMASALASGVIGHLSIWEGWSALIAAALFGYRAAPWWIPILVALLINPEPFGLVSDLVHGRHASLYAALMFTLCQLVLAYAGLLVGRLAKRVR